MYNILIIVQNPNFFNSFREISEKDKQKNRERKIILKKVLLFCNLCVIISSVWRHSSVG